MAYGFNKQYAYDNIPAKCGYSKLLYYVRMITVCWLLLVGLWSAPAFGALLVYPNYLLEVEILLAVVLILSGRQGCVLRLSRYPFLLPSIVVIIIAAVAAFFRITYLQTSISNETLHLAQHAEPLLRAMLIFFALAGDKDLLRMGWYSAMAGLLLNALASVIQHFTQVTRWFSDLDRGWRDGWSPYRGIPEGETGQHFSPRTQGLTSYINTTAAMLAAALPYWIVPIIKRVIRKWPAYLFFIAGTLLTTAGLWYTNSRGPMLAVLLVIFVLAIMLHWRWLLALLAANIVVLLTAAVQSMRLALAEFIAAVLLSLVALRYRWRYTWPLIAALAIAGGLMSIDGYLLHFDFNSRMVEQGVGDRARLVLYDDAIKTTLSSPWIGVGEEQIAENLLHLPYRGLRNLPRSQHNYHNTILHWSAAEGIPLALAMTIFTIGAIVWCWRAFRHALTPFSRSLTLASTIGMTIYLLCNMVDAHFWRMEGAAFFWSLLALTAAAARSEGEDY